MSDWNIGYMRRASRFIGNHGPAYRVRVDGGHPLAELSIIPREALVAATTLPCRQ